MKSGKRPFFLENDPEDFTPILYFFREILKIVGDNDMSIRLYGNSKDMTFFRIR